VAQLEIRQIQFQVPRLCLVKRAEKKQDEAETDGYLGNVGKILFAIDYRQTRMGGHPGFYFCANQLLIFV
jgi:hypothetical protein